MHVKITPQQKSTLKLVTKENEDNQINHRAFSICQKVPEISLDMFGRVNVLHWRSIGHILKFLSLSNCSLSKLKFKMEAWVKGGRE